MQSENKNTFIILGLLAHKPLTGYEIKLNIDKQLSFFWNAGYGSIYPTLASIENSGYATSSSIVENSRSKIIYTITEKGKEHLKEWLERPVKKDELRYETLVKLFFSSEVGDAEALKHIIRFEENVRAKLAIFEVYEKNLENVSTKEKHKYILLTVMFGIETYKSYLIWCKKAKSLLTDKK